MCPEHPRVQRKRQRDDRAVKPVVLMKEVADLAKTPDVAAKDPRVVIFDEPVAGCRKVDGEKECDGRRIDDRGEKAPSRRPVHSR
jgi:hypothetical protein